MVPIFLNFEKAVCGQIQVASKMRLEAKVSMWFQLINFQPATLFLGNFPNVYTHIYIYKLDMSIKISYLNR